MHSCIDSKIQPLRKKHVKKHILKGKRHLNFLNNFHKDYVLVPADKAADNVIVICKKYYLEIVLKELETTSTYEMVNVCCEEVIQKHLEYTCMMSSDIKVEKQMEDLPAFYWLPKLHFAVSRTMTMRSMC